MALLGRVLIIANMCFQVRSLNPEGLTNGNSIEPAVWLDRLAAVFRYVEQPHSSNVAAVPNDVKCACVPAFSEVSLSSDCNEC